ncbi:hypothetical protein ACFQJD_13385 [Haloplanus sp. GCM10025708]|uniref:DUF7827 domain-containing protein n=1 Tax=Haloplanus sp. GCM10025708 TaxID=3252679 RepID=UPI00360FC36C
MSVAVAPVAAASSNADSGSPSVGFGEAVTTDQRGDVVAVPLRLHGVSEATLSIRAADGAYRSRVGVRDGDGDGNVTVRFNTFRAGWRSGERAAFSAAGEGLDNVGRADVAATVDPRRHRAVQPRRLHAGVEYVRRSRTDAGVDGRRHRERRRGRTTAVGCRRERHGREGVRGGRRRRG